MLAVFDAPVSTDRSGQEFGPRQVRTDVEPRLPRLLIMTDPSRRHRHECPQILPYPALGMIWRDFQNSADPLVDAAVPRLAGFGGLMWHVLKVRVEGVLEEQLHIFLKSRLVPLQCQDVMRFLLTDLRGDLLLAPIASIVTVQPLRLSSLSSSGIAVISLDFSSQATCPSVRPFSLAQAVTRCSIALPDFLANDRRMPCHQC